MSTNPNNAVGTNAAYGGRTSVKAFNDDLAAYTSGIMSGWGCVPNSGMTVSLGGDGSTRDVAVAEDNAGNKTTINNISGSPINVTLGAAPGSNSRIDVIVAYVDNPPQGSSSVADNPAACGIIAVQGTPANTPVVPNDGTIRTAITADGASGTTAYYVILAQITVASGTTDIISQDIAAGPNAAIGTEQINNGAVTSDKIDFTTINYQTSQVQLTFETGGTTVGTGNGTLIKLDNNIGILLFSGDTGWNDAGTGNRGLEVHYSVGFTKIIGGSVNSHYVGMPGAYQAFSRIYANFIDNYVVKPDATQKMRGMQFVIYGSFS